MIEPAVPVVAFPIALFLPQVQLQFPFRYAQRRRAFSCDCCTRLALSPTSFLPKFQRCSIQATDSSQPSAFPIPQIGFHCVFAQ
ncbi:hypothetical protein BGW80DRAFT_1340578 [Lactifluus volemus]|nr:hypothetical protein BGW80DRAFT_1340578 [Lactifluus volemus]